MGANDGKKKPSFASDAPKIGDRLGVPPRVFCCEGCVSDFKKAVSGY
jgi:hypothetical protein